MPDGRAAELSRIIDAMERAAGAAFLIVGDAGIGKSTFVAHLVDAARARGLPVVTTRWSDDAASPPMWSWTVLVRNWMTQVGPHERLGEVHPLVRRLVPEIADALALAVPDAPADELAGRFATGDGLGRLFAGSPRPIVVVLEDLHHASSGGLGFLETFAAAALDGPVLIIATSRDGSSGASLAPLPATRRVDLAPLDRSEAEELVRSVVADLSQDAVDAVIERAGGNPFFLSELARLAATNDAGVATTRAVRDVVMRRVDALGDAAHEVLAIAALLGRKPRVDLLADVLGDGAAVDHVLDMAEQARLIDVDGMVMRWSHDLARDAVTESLRSQERRQLHTRIVGALAREPYPDTFQLAHHLLESGTDSAAAADASEAAANAATDAGAHEEAARWADRAMAVTERLPDRAARARRLDLIAGRSLIAINDYAAGRTRLVQCAEQSLAAGDVEAAAVALLTIGAERLTGSDDVEPPAALVDMAIARLSHRRDLQIRLIGRSADLLVDRDASHARVAEALEAARETGDSDLIILALTRQLLSWRATSLVEHTEALAEIERHAANASPEHQFEAQAVRIVVLLEQGRVDEASVLIPTIDAAVLRLGLPQALAFDWTAALIHLLQGRFDAAEEAAAEMVASAPGAKVMEPLARQASFNALTSILRGEFTDFLALTDFYLEMTAGTMDALRVHGFAALGGVFLGERERAQRSLDEVFRVGLYELMNLFFGQGAVFALLLAEAACLLGNLEQAAILEGVLEPYSGRVPIGGMAPVIAFGGADHALAMCAHLRGDGEVARTRIDAAIELHERMAAGPFLARSKLVSADIAVSEGDDDRVVDDARAAAKLATRYGMRIVAERAAALLASRGAAPVRGARVGGIPTAIVFTDIESSTASAAALGDAAWLERLRNHDVIVRKLVAQHSGREVKHMGDGFMLTFPSAGDAIDFAIALQRSFDGALVRVRAGIHVGPVVEEDGDIFGTTVNVTARVCAVASGGETLVTDDVLMLVPHAKTTGARAASLKGVPEPMQLHTLAQEAVKS